MKTHIDNTIEERIKSILAEHDIEFATAYYDSRIEAVYQIKDLIKIESKRYADERVIEYEKFRQMKDMKKVGIENPTIDDDCWALDLVNEFLNQNTESEEGVR